MLGIGFHRQNPPGGGKFPKEGVSFPEKILNWGNLKEFPYEIVINCLTLSLPTLLVKCLTLSLPTQFCMWRCSGGIIRGLFFACFDFQEKIATEGDIFRVIEKPIRN